MIETIDQLVIEVTRKCNMNCMHCLRGKAQDLDFDPILLKTFLSKLEYVSTLTMGGGEPSLAPDSITGVVEEFENSGVSVGQTAIITNGKAITKEFVWALCELNKISEEFWLYVSKDKYHEEIPDKNLKLLKGFNPIDKEVYTVILEGKARENSVMFEQNPISEIGNDKFTIESNSIYEDEVYLNVKGNVIGGCNWSYESQDNPQHIICSIKDFSLKKVIEYNKRKEGENGKRTRYAINRDIQNQRSNTF